MHVEIGGLSVSGNYLLAHIYILYIYIIHITQNPDHSSIDFEKAKIMTRRPALNPSLRGGTNVLLHGRAFSVNA